ncbi:MAG: glycoside hydrolase family 2 TIM barrel-domain containing protein [Luteolibacter sp.]
MELTDLQPASNFTQSLNGPWKFKLIEGLNAGADEKFYESGFNLSSWKSIPVPANWEIIGVVAEPGYRGGDEYLGLYRRNFKVPADWSENRRVFIRFEGVYWGFQAWMNGEKIGESNVGATLPHTFDVTDILKKGGENTLSVQATTRPFGWEFDSHDDWALNGIYRDVTVFSLPTLHVKSVVARTTVDKDGGVQLSVTAKTTGDALLRGTLLDAGEKEVASFDLPRQGDDYTAAIRVENPKLWTAETPNLYTLKITLSDGRSALQTVQERIGLREVRIEGNVLLLNNVPIKLRGVNRHDETPETGRMPTEEGMRRDLELMRKANINFIRMAHYPPNRRLLELCDELGFYVMDEMPMGGGDKQMKDPAYYDHILARTAALVARDKNHPSVLVWSIGNENDVIEVDELAGQLIRKLDPSRPYCFPKVPSRYRASFDKNPKYGDIGSPHYVGNSALRGYVKKDHPIIITEYAHALGLSTDRIQEQWEILQNNPGGAGGAIWHFQDQGLLRTSKDPVDPSSPTMHVWLDKNRYYDNRGNEGADGIVYADRTPQTDYWLVRKVYSPIQIKEDAATVQPGKQFVSFTVENRHDFVSLEGMKLDWSLNSNGKELQKGSLQLTTEARKKDKLGVDVEIPADADRDILTLELRAISKDGTRITERTLRLNLPDVRTTDWSEDLPAAGPVKVTGNDKEITIQGANATLTVQRSSGELSLRDPSGKTLIEGIYPHPGRRFTMTDEALTRKMGAWPQSLLTKAEKLEIKTAQKDGSVTLSVSGQYPRPEKTGQLIVGGYEATFAPNGTITVNYHYQPENASGQLTETGLSLVIPRGFPEFRWIGEGPYPGYPGKDRLNEFGLFHLNREDLYFQGNRRKTELAMLTTADGVGVAIAAQPGDIAVQREGDGILLRHNALISSLGNKFWVPEQAVKADDKKKPDIKGSFTIIPLGKEWPETLTRWFGKPTAAKDIFKPFVHSYDQ